MKFIFYLICSKGLCEPSYLVQAEREEEISERERQLTTPLTPQEAYAQSLEEAAV